MAQTIVLGIKGALAERLLGSEWWHRVSPRVRRRVFAVQVLGPGVRALDSVLPVEVLYEPAVRWVILGLAVVGALVAAFWPAQALQSEVVEGPSETEAAEE